MKKLLLPLLPILLLMACQKEATTTKAQEEIVVAATNKQTKFFVCHYDAVTGTSKTIQVDQSALAGHLAHGDVQGECSTVQTTTICNQVWMVKNLDVTTYRNGDVIPEVTDPTAWASLTTGAWCYYNNDPANGSIYGKMYNWYALNDPRGLAPIGWHVPTIAEWETLATCLGGVEVAGGAMKSMGTIEAATGLWYAPNTSATNSSGFTGLPGGYRALDGSFYSIGLYNSYWSSTSLTTDYVWFGELISVNGALTLGASAIKVAGLSIRCVKD